MIYAPFVVPTLNRSEKFIRLMESLKKNTWACYTDVIVSVDFPPSEKYYKGRQEILDYLEHGDFSSFRQLIVIKQPKNLGAGKNGFFLQTYIEQHNYDRWIRCDDDCEFSPNFLEFMDKCLDAFENDESVAAVTGYSYPIDWSVSEGATCMKQQFNASTWGLGRWVKKVHGIREYINSGKMLGDAEMVIKTKRHKKMQARCYLQYFNQATSNNNDSGKILMTTFTDIAFRAYLACQDKYCISPTISKVKNYGFDGTGVVCRNTIGLDNTTVNTYDYRKQEIDNSDHFDIVLNDPQLLHENKLKIDAFEGISKRDLRLASIKVAMIRFFGVKFAKKVMAIVNPKKR